MWQTVLHPKFLPPPTKEKKINNFHSGRIFLVRDEHRAPAPHTLKASDLSLSYIPSSLIGCFCLFCCGCEHPHVSGPVCMHSYSVRKQTLRGSKEPNDLIPACVSKMCIRGKPLCKTVDAYWVSDLPSAWNSCLYDLFCLYKIRIKNYSVV